MVSHLAVGNAGPIAPGPGRQGRKVHLAPRDVPRTPGRRSRPRIRHCLHAARKRGRSPLIPWPKLIWSTSTYLSYGRCSYGDQPALTLQHVRARATATGQIFSLAATGSNHPVANRQRGQSPRSARLYGAPWRDRTAYLLLTIYPRADAVANCEDAGQVRGGALCCSPTYLFITPAGLGGGP